MFDFSENYKISKKCAEEGIVLLKNDEDILPFGSSDKIALVGKDSFELLKGGGGSADVNSLYVRNIFEGLSNRCGENKVQLDKNSVSFSHENFYSASELNSLAENSDIAVVTIKVFACEGADRLLFSDAVSENIASGELYMSKEEIEVQRQSGCYYPSKEKIRFFEELEKSNFKSVVVILNVASVIDLSFLEKFSKVKAILLAYLPGMEGGEAIADVLCGVVNPSGKTTDTFALSYDDYSSSPYFNKHHDISEYKEGIFVGYRHFETYAKNRVLYPFGYGLSYTSFKIDIVGTAFSDDEILVNLNVQNTGKRAGKEVVQLYTSSPEGALVKPSVELRGWKKTKLLIPGENERIAIKIKYSDMASFDEFGDTGYPYSWVLEKGEYKIFAGNSVRNIFECAKYYLDQTVLVKSLSKIYTDAQHSLEKEALKPSGNKGITLYDVFDNKNTIEEFVSQLTVEELVHLSQGQPPAFAKGTAGVGNMQKYLIPNPQTADGPAGLRKSVPTTCFPCGTLIASCWNEQIQYAVGLALGNEGVSTGVDILLAPSMNIHRNPLCGRNFEYYSEDPIVSGKTASAVVKGVQDAGMSATIKHFFANNCEFNRQKNNSVIDERTIREIYLKGFEIVVKEAKPHYVMTSYNLVNGIKCSTTASLLCGVLRDEWGFDGAVMTDWRNSSTLWEEIKAGNNIKMPFGYPDEAELALQKHEEGVLSLAELQDNACCVLRAVMKSVRFKNKFFGIVHKISSEEAAVIKATDVAGISSTRASESVCDNKPYLFNLGKDQRNIPTFAYYFLDVEEDGVYDITIDTKTDTKGSCVKIEINDTDSYVAPCDGYKDSETWFKVSALVKMKKGINNLKITPINFPHEKVVPLVGVYHMVEEQFALLEINIKRVGDI